MRTIQKEVETISKEDSEVVEWLKTKGDSTKIVYWNAIKTFSEFTGWTPKQMLDEREKEFDLRPRERGKVASKVEEFFLWLIEKGKSETTAKSYVGGIASFYKRYNMRLLLDWRSNFQGTTKAVNVTACMHACACKDRLNIHLPHTRSYKVREELLAKLHTDDHALLREMRKKH